METKGLIEAISFILTMTLPAIKNLITSKFVPFLKREAYERLDNKADKLIQDLAQNASKIANETDENKRFAYITGTKLGVDMLRKVGEKLIKACDEIEKVL